MAGGITTPALVSSVSNSGALGSLAAGYLLPDEIRNEIQKIKGLTQKPFSVNLFISEAHYATADEMKRACIDIQNACHELSIDVGPTSPPYAPNFDEQMFALIDSNISIMSFTFGVLNKSWIDKLKNINVTLIGTVTHVDEAKLLEEAGIDIVVPQGIEAGGHRGTFLGDALSYQKPMIELLSEITSVIKIPVIAAGGIMNAENIKSAMKAGATAVQMGTAFLSTHESGANAAYKKAVLHQSKDNTVLTKAFSGKYARSLKNIFVERMKDKYVLPYPIQNALTGSMRKFSKEKGNCEFMSLSSGAGVMNSEEISVSDLIAKLVEVFQTS